MPSCYLWFVGYLLSLEVKIINFVIKSFTKQATKRHRDLRIETGNQTNRKSCNIQDFLVAVFVF